MQLYRVRKYNSGFTLIEMMVVVIIVGVIAAIAAPNLLGMLNRSRVDEAMRQIAGGLKEAQKQAEKKGKKCEIEINESDYSKVLSNTTDPNKEGCLLSNRSTHNSVELKSSRTKIEFSGRGSIVIDGTNPVPVLVVSMPNGTNSIKCVVVENSFGAITTGSYTGDLSDPLDSDNCQ